MTLLVTGGAGFIGSHVVRHFVKTYPETKLINFDLLTYAGNLANLEDVEGSSNYVFIQGDVADISSLRKVFHTNDITGVLHLAAESHVDRSISNPLEFVRTNTLGTATLLQVCLEHWGKDFTGKKFLHVSTDEVFGSLGSQGLFQESTPYDPQSPYSAAKASSDHFVRAYYHTYGLPAVISNCSNNYGSHQFPEKLIPVCILNILNDCDIPVYGTGDNVRDWLYVDDHVHALDLIFHQGKIGESYNVGGRCEVRNIDLVKKLCDLVDERRGTRPGTARKLISFVEDRAGHDFRYAVDSSKLEKEGWRARMKLEEGLRRTVSWYFDNLAWCDDIRTGRYQERNAVKISAGAL